MAKFKVEIEGTSDYLQNKMVMATKEEQKAKSKLTGSVKGQEAIDMHYEEKVYRAEDGSCYIPSTHLEGAMIKAATEYIIPGKGKKTWKDIFKGLVICTENKIQFSPKKKNPDEKYEAITRNPATGGRNVTIRPLYAAGWKAEFEIDCLDEAIDSDLLAEILGRAGQYKGIGDYRPKFGRFQVNKVVLVK